MTEEAIVARIERKFDTKFRELMEKIVFRDVYHSDTKKIDERCEAREKRLDKIESLVMKLLISSFFVLLGVVVQFIMLFMSR